jgi:hypothetical protein
MTAYCQKNSESAGPPRASTPVYLTIDRGKIAWLTFLLESYEGLAVLRTVDPAAGRVLLLVAPGEEDETAELIQSIQEDLGLVPGLSDEPPWRPV